MAAEKENVKFIWMPRENDLKELWDRVCHQTPEKNVCLKHASLSRFAQFIRKVLDVQLIIKDVQPKSNVTSLSKKNLGTKISTKVDYCDPLFVVHCELLLPSTTKNYKTKLINSFCSSKKFFQSIEWSWMSFDMDFLTGNLKLENYIAYRETEVCSFALGSIVGLNTFVKHVDSMSLEKYDPKYKITHINAKYAQEYFEIYFNVGQSNIPVPKRSIDTHGFFKLCFTHVSLHQLLICHDGKDFSLYFCFLEGPLLYRAFRKKQVAEKSKTKKKKGDVSDEEEEHRYITYNNMDHSIEWFRALNLFEEDCAKLKRELAMNFVLRLQFKRTEYTFIKHLLKQFCNHVTPYFTPMEIVSEWLDSPIKSVSSNNFDCLYALKCILTRNNELIDQVSVLNCGKEVNAFLAEKCKENSAVLSEAIIWVYNLMDQGGTMLFLPTLKITYDRLFQETKLMNSNKKSDSDKVVCIKRAILMPTHVHFLPPQPQLYNRILRSCNPDYLMRVMIRDTNLQQINYTVKFFGKGSKKIKKQFVQNHIMRNLAGGVKIGKRTYNYLGMSSSQLKSHSVWCYANDPENRKTIEEVRKDIGDLDKILEVPKFMARMGQSFSQAMGRIKVPQELTNNNDPEPDIEGKPKIYMSNTDSDEDDDDDDDEKIAKRRKKGKKFLDEKCIDGEKYDTEVEDDSDEETEAVDDPYIFSDGIGRMSKEIAEQIYEELEMQEEQPSAFQVRYAGCKGMLVIDPTLKGKQIIFRKSMKKYDSKDDSLEILKISKLRILHLNRPLITILEQKGITKETFLLLQKKMIRSSIKSMFYDEDAKEMLKCHSLLRLNYDHLMNVGLSFTEDPLFRSMILAIFKNKISLLKTKARIAIPVDKGRNMFGVLDETKTLEYGQVFVQYTLSNGLGTRVLQGDVVVTKTPCLHPGDVRKFTAIDVPKLRHIKDCIVFPAKGERPHPDEMAGSDLDGDEYCVIWLEDLIFYESNSPPMHYAMPKKIKSDQSDRPIQISDEHKHFCNYILNDSVGRLASAHLARADLEKDGIKSKVCLRIAKKHAKAVDFAKSGCPANMTRDETAFTYPDFMEKFNRSKTYVSDKALGHLYRNCRNLEHGLEATTDKMEFQLDQDLFHDSWHTYKNSAHKTYHRYCKKLSTFLKSYSITNEGEFLSGNFVERTKLISDNNERMNFLEMIEFETIWLLQMFQKEFFQEFGGKPASNKFTDAMLQKASAWYVVSYSGDLQGETRYFGLPWMVSDVLAALKREKRKEHHLSSNILEKKASYIETAIDKRLGSPGADDIDKQDIEIFKTTILDKSREVLDKWLLCLKDVNNDYKLMEKYVDEQFDAISEGLMCASENFIRRCQKETHLQKILSPGYYILSTLISLSEMGTGHADLNAQFASNLQEFGLWAWVTLIRLACSCNLQYLGFPDEEGNYAPISFYKKQDTRFDTFYIETKDKEFWNLYRENEELIKKYVEKRFKLEDVALHPEYTYNNYIRLSVNVIGSPYAVDCLKHEIIKESFTKDAVKKSSKKSVLKSPS